MLIRRILFSILLVSLSYCYSSAQVINTVAGNGSIGYSGDGAQATLAQLNALAVTVDDSGNLYIPDAANNRVRKVDGTGIINTIAGTGTAGYNVDSGAALTTLLYNPSSVAIDTAGNIYIADQRNQRIRKVDTAGVMTVIAGVGLTGFSGDDSAAVNAKLNNPISVAADTFGNIFIVDYGNNRIRKINPAGIITTVAGTGLVGHTGDGGLATAATLDTPTCVAVDLAGNLFIADRGNNCIRKVNTSGIISNFAGSAAGTLGFAGDSTGATSALLAHPYGVAVDDSGNVYIADEENQRVRMVNTADTIYTIAGTGVLSFCGDNGDPMLACLNHPKGVAVDHLHNVYIADAFNNRIRKITVPVVGVKTTSINKAGIRLYPNPNTGSFNIEGRMKAKDGVLHLQMLDMTGRIVMSSSVAIVNERVNAQIQIPANVPGGMYLLQLNTDTERKTILFQKQ